MPILKLKIVDARKFDLIRGPGVFDKYGNRVGQLIAEEVDLPHDHQVANLLEVEDARTREGD